MGCTSSQTQLVKDQTGQRPVVVPPSLLAAQPPCTNATNGVSSAPHTATLVEPIRQFELDETSERGDRSKPNLNSDLTLFINPSSDAGAIGEKSSEATNSTTKLLPSAVDAKISDLQVYATTPTDTFRECEVHGTDEPQKTTLLDPLDRLRDDGSLVSERQTLTLEPVPHCSAENAKKITKETIQDFYRDLFARISTLESKASPTTKTVDFQSFRSLVAVKGLVDAEVKDEIDLFEEFEQQGADAENCIAESGFIDLMGIVETWYFQQFRRYSDDHAITVIASCNNKDNNDNNSSGCEKQDIENTGVIETKRIPLPNPTVTLSTAAPQAESTTGDGAAVNRIASSAESATMLTPQSRTLLPTTGSAYPSDRQLDSTPVNNNNSINNKQSQALLSTLKPVGASIPSNAPPLVSAAVAHSEVKRPLLRTPLVTKGALKHVKLAHVATLSPSPSIGPIGNKTAPVFSPSPSQKKGFLLKASFNNGASASTNNNNNGSTGNGFGSSTPESAVKSRLNNTTSDSSSSSKSRNYNHPNSGVDGVAGGKNPSYSSPHPLTSGKKASSKKQFFVLENGTLSYIDSTSRSPPFSIDNRDVPLRDVKLSVLENNVLDLSTPKKRSVSSLTPDGRGTDAAQNNQFCDEGNENIEQNPVLGQGETGAEREERESILTLEIGDEIERREWIKAIQQHIEFSAQMSELSQQDQVNGADENRQLDADSGSNITLASALSSE